MLDRIHDLYEELEDQRIMLSFKGDLTPDLITALLGLVERKLEQIEPDGKLRKRVFNVLMECLQNLYHHHARIAAEDSDGRGTDEAQGVVMIGHHGQGYSVLTGNFMAGDQVERLRAHLDRINAMDEVGLRDFYKQILTDGRFSEAGGGGLE